VLGNSKFFYAVSINITRESVISG